MIPALKISHLTKHFDGVPVVKGISFEIAQGEIFGLLGPNGAGKSTTINIVSGVAKLESGSVEVLGFDNQKQFRRTRRLVGVVNQEVVYDPFFKVGDALKIHSGYYGVKDDPAWRNLLIERLALGPHLQKSMNKLSGGMKRRFMVAKALVHKPSVLVLDEPTAGVDVELRRALWEFVRQINQRGTTVLLTTHYLEEAEQMCGRVAIMNQGEIVALEETKLLMQKLDKKRMWVRLIQPVKMMPEELNLYKPRAQEEGHLLEFTLSRENDTGRVLKILYDKGIAVAEVDTKTSSLEDVFVSLTREERAMPRGRS